MTWHLPSAIVSVKSQRPPQSLVVFSLGRAVDHIPFLHKEATLTRHFALFGFSFVGQWDHSFPMLSKTCLQSLSTKEVLQPPQTVSPEGTKSFKCISVGRGNFIVKHNISFKNVKSRGRNSPFSHMKHYVTKHSSEQHTQHKMYSNLK